MSRTFTIKAIISILSCIGAGLIVISTLKYGAGVSPDSVEYLASAQNLLTGRGFLSFDSLPITQWPPLYPFLLFLFSYIVGISTAVSAIVINTILFGLIIYESGMVLVKYISDNSIIIIGLLAVLFSIPIFYVAVWVWSELLFVILTIWYFRSLENYCNKKNLLSILIVAAFTALAMLTRYIGIILILTTIIAVLYYGTDGLKKNIFSIMVYSFLSAAPLSIWIIRNYLISGTLFGERGASKFSLLYNIYLTLEVILSWANLGHFISLKTFLIIIITFTFILVGILVLNKFKSQLFKLSIDRNISFILLSFIIIYLASLIIISTIKAHNPIDNRLLSPIYIPLTLILLLILQEFYYRIYSFRYYKQLRIALSILLLLGITRMFSSTFNTITHHYKEGTGYSGISWQKNKDDDWLKSIERKENMVNSTIYCNDPFALYYLENIFAKWSPRKTYYDSDDIYVILKDLQGRWPEEKEAYLVWFKKVEFVHEPLYQPEEIASISKINVIDSTEIGILYAVRRLSSGGNK